MSFENFRVHTRLNLNLNLKVDLIESVYAKIAAIDAVKNSWHMTGRLLPQAINRLTHSVIVTSSGASNRIEGNRMTDLEVESLYKKLRIKKFRTRDEQEIAGYIECLEIIFKHYADIPIKESYILQLHAEMLKHSDKDLYHKGKYKSGTNRAEAKDHAGNIVAVIFDPTPPYLVPKEMQELIDWYNWASNTRVKHPLILIANFIFEYLAIHPFQDGNGRTSRLLTNLLLLQHGYTFSSIVSHEKIIEENKLNYYMALNKTQSTWKNTSEDISSWLLFFLDIISKQSEQTMNIIMRDNIEYLLSAKQLALWQWVQTLDVPFSRKDAVAALNFPERTVESIIKKLVDLKRLKRLGQGKGIRYQLIEL